MIITVNVHKPNGRSGGPVGKSVRPASGRLGVRIPSRVYSQYSFIFIGYNYKRMTRVTVGVAG